MSHCDNKLQRDVKWLTPQMNGRIKKFSEKKYPVHIIIYPEKQFKNDPIELSVVSLS